MRKRKTAVDAAAEADAGKGPDAKDETKKADPHAAHGKRIKALEDRVDALVSKLGGIIGTSVED